MWCNLALTLSRTRAAAAVGEEEEWHEQQGEGVMARDSGGTSWGRAAGSSAAALGLAAEHVGAEERR